MVLALFFITVLIAAITISLQDVAARQAMNAHNESRLRALTTAEAGLQIALARLNSGEGGDLDGTLAELESAPAVAFGSAGWPAELFTPVDPANTADTNDDGFVDFAAGAGMTEQLENFRRKDDGSFATRVRRIDDTTFLVRSVAVSRSGRRSEGTVRVLDTVMKAERATIFGDGRGFLAANDMELRKDGFVDSYDSGGDSFDVVSNPGNTPQAYAPTNKEVVIRAPDGTLINTGELATYQNAKVTLGGNGTVDVEKDTKVTGLVAYGPNGSSTDGNGFGIGAIELESEIPIEQPSFELPATDNNNELDPAIFDKSSEVKTAKKASYTMGVSGETKQYVFDKFRTRKGGTATIEGNVELYVTKEFDFDQDTTIKLAPGATLKIFTDVKLDFDKNIKINEGGYPLAVQIISKQDKGDSGGVEIGIDKTSVINAVIDAPGVRVRFDKGATFFGAILGYDVRIKKDANVHYDEALARGYERPGSLGEFKIVGFAEPKSFAD